MQLENLVGLHKLTGVEYTSMKCTGFFGSETDAQGIAFVLDGHVYLALEDENDGYRSACRDLIANDRHMVSNIFEPVEVFCIYGADREMDTLDIWDINTNKKILSVGTDNRDGYYPCFVGVFHPEYMIHNKYQDTIERLDRTLADIKRELPSIEERTAIEIAKLIPHTIFKGVDNDTEEVLDTLLESYNIEVGNLLSNVFPCIEDAFERSVIDCFKAEIAELTN